MKVTLNQTITKNKQTSTLSIKRGKGGSKKGSYCYVSIPAHYIMELVGPYDLMPVSRVWLKKKGFRPSVLCGPASAVHANKLP